MSQAQGTEMQAPPTLASLDGDLGTKMCAARQLSLSDSDLPTHGNILLPVLFLEKLLSLHTTSSLSQPPRAARLDKTGSEQGEAPWPELGSTWS